MALQNAFIKISELLRKKNQMELGNDLGQMNISNDVQKPIDIHSNDIMVNAAKQIKGCIGYVSEEESELILFEERINDRGVILVFDPLDGSKNVLSNLTAGTIYALYDYDVVLDKILSIEEAGYALYGPATIMVSSLDDKVVLYQLDERNKVFSTVCYLSELNTKNEKILAINALNDLNNKYTELIDRYRADGYTHRWAGAMVADCHQVIMRGGIFMYPENMNAFQGKIRLIYEAVPMAYIFKLLGGVAIDTNDNCLVEKVRMDSLMNNIHHKVPVIMCSEEEYLKLTSLLFSK
jgi:fructose-1,6-bisphosphatase I